jgi:hypothetical protein
MDFQDLKRLSKMPRELNFNVIKISTFGVSYKLFYNLKKGCLKDKITDKEIKSSWDRLVKHYKDGTFKNQKKAIETLNNLKDVFLSIKYNEYDENDITDTLATQMLSWEYKDESETENESESESESETETETETETENESEEEDDFKQIYYTETFDEYIGEDDYGLHKLQGGDYYQTYGGGPEGGYVILPNDEIYEVKRSWFTPFEIVKQIKGKYIIQNEDRKKSLCYGIKIIEEEK